jgi:hypothetical protein
MNPKKEKSWHKQQENILKTWGEQSSCYRYMHFKAYQKYKKMSMRFTLPIIIISTLTGTANFAQETFPTSWKKFVPVGIGGLNLVAAIMTTILQFLKINELMESHRVSSVHYGKLSRSIRLQMTLPRYERSHNGSEFVEFCNQEYDRLIEQSPPIPGKILKMFEKEYPQLKVPLTPLNKKKSGCFPCCEDNIDLKDKELELARPEIMKLAPITLYDHASEIAAATAAKKFRFGPPKPSFMLKKPLQPEIRIEIPPVTKPFGEPEEPKEPKEPEASSDSEEELSVQDRIKNLEQSVGNPPVQTD